MRKSVLTGVVLLVAALLSGGAELAGEIEVAGDDAENLDVTEEEGGKAKPQADANVNPEAGCTPNYIGETPADNAAEVADFLFCFSAGLTGEGYTGTAHPGDHPPRIVIDGPSGEIPDICFTEKDRDIQTVILTVDDAATDYQGRILKFSREAHADGGSITIYVNETTSQISTVPEQVGDDLNGSIFTAISDKFAIVDVGDYFLVLHDKLTRNGIWKLGFRVMDTGLVSSQLALEPPGLAGTTNCPVPTY